MSARQRVELTPRQAWAACQALNSYLDAGTWDEQLVLFGSSAGVEAARRAERELARAAQPYLRAFLRREGG